VPSNGTDFVQAAQGTSAYVFDMQRTFFTLAAVCVLTACTARENAGKNPRSLAMSVEHPERNAQTVKRLYEEAINQRKHELYPALVAAEYVGPRGERGPAGFADTLHHLIAGIPNIRFEIQELVAEGDRVAVRWRWAGRHTGSLFGVPASGRDLHNDGIAIYHLRDAKVVAASLQTDRLGVLQQVGLVPLDVSAPRSSSQTRQTP
jgi:predicted ester cyclase